MLRQRHSVLISLSFFLGAIAALAQQPSALKIEKKPAYIAAGRGQTPFNVTRHIIRLGDIQSGGPSKDGIPALNHPAFISATQADHVLRPFDVVLGVEFDGVAKAYPVRILNWHEVVNDDVRKQPVLISWCPLCGSGIVYDPRIGSQRYIFGVSGLLYKRNLLLYDRETQSLWSQLAGVAVTGPMVGTFLRHLPATETTWAHWKNEHPQALVLSFHTGYRRDYSEDPYRNWPIDRRPALVVQNREVAKIYPFSQLRKALKNADGPFVDNFDGLKISIFFDSKSQTAVVKGPQGEPVSHFVAFLADARAFYPRALIFKAR